MSEPAPGWYPDPSGGGGLRYWNGTAWTPSTQGGGARGGRIGLLIGGGLLVLALFAAGTIALVSNAAKNNDANHAPIATTSTTPTATIAPRPQPSASSTGTPTDLGSIPTPADWVAGRSNRGAYTYKYSPEWTDASALIGDIETQFEVPGATSEAGGAWIAGGTILNGGALIFPIALSDGSDVLSLRLELAGVEQELKSEYGSVEKIASDSFVTPQGYEGMREIYRADTSNGTLLSGAYIIKAKKTLVIVSVTSTSTTPDFETETMAFINSIVVKHPPR